MPPGEITVTCPGCGFQARLPIAALRRDNSYCSQCGKRIPLSGVQIAPGDTGPNPTRAKRRTYRPTKRR